MIILYRYHLYARYLKPGEKCRHFHYPDYFTYLDTQKFPMTKGVWIIEVLLYMYILINDNNNIILTHKHICAAVFLHCHPELRMGSCQKYGTQHRSKKWHTYKCSCMQLVLLTYFHL